MSFGFRCVSESGFTQVDDEYDNLAVLMTGTVEVSRWVGHNEHARFKYDNPVVLPNSVPDDYVCFARVAPAYRDHGYAFKHFLMNFSPSALSVYSGVPTADRRKFWLIGGVFSDHSLAEEMRFHIEYKICVRSRDMPASPNTGYGLKVFKANGEESYSSNNENFRLIAANPTFEPHSHFFDNNREWVFNQADMEEMYMIMNGKQIIYGISTDSLFSVWLGYGVAFNYDTNTVSTGGIHTAFAPGWHPFGGRGGRNTIVIDILGKFT